MGDQEKPDQLTHNDFVQILKEFDISPVKFWDFFEFHRGLTPTTAHQAELDFMNSATRADVVKIIAEYHAHVDRLSKMLNDDSSSRHD